MANYKSIRDRKGAGLVCNYACAPALVNAFGSKNKRTKESVRAKKKNPLVHGFCGLVPLIFCVGGQWRSGHIGLNYNL